MQHFWPSRANIANLDFGNVPARMQLCPAIAPVNHLSGLRAHGWALQCRLRRRAIPPGLAGGNRDRPHHGFVNHRRDANDSEGIPFMRLSITVAALMTFAFATSTSATTCTQAVARCKLAGSTKPNIDSQCEAAGASCMKDGTFIGPVTHTPWKNLRRQ